MSTLDQRLITLRGTQSRRAFAKKIGVTESTLRNYENSITRPPADILENICNILRAEPKWLLLGEGNMLIKDKKIPSFPILSIQKNYRCKRCQELEKKLEDERTDWKDLAKENRVLWRENTILRTEINTHKIANL